MWFKRLTGFSEESPEQVRKLLTVQGKELVSTVNGQSFQYGKLEVCTLERLRAKTASHTLPKGKIRVREIVGDVQGFHRDPMNQHALFQAASQFNLLEMVGPHITPEQGVDRYSFDPTQGPACAIACGAGTIYRNYFAEVNGQLGQTENNQIDCLDLIGKEMNNHGLRLWSMRNGYAIVNQAGLLYINSQLSKLDHPGREHLKGKIKIGVQWDTEVTISESKHLVSQAYCSALPVAYHSFETFYWEYFARLVLEATYEATLSAALLNLQNSGSDKVYLTLVGGGAFGNDTSWIIESLELTLKKFSNIPLDVAIVSYGHSNPYVRSLAEKFQK